MHVIIRLFMIFVGGIVFALLIIQALPFIYSVRALGGENTIKKEVNSRVEKLGKEKAAQANNTAGGVLSSVSESSALSPIFQTKKKVENTIDAVISLPDEQKKAICRQICE